MELGDAARVDRAAPGIRGEQVVQQAHSAEGGRGLGIGGMLLGPALEALEGGQPLTNGITGRCCFGCPHQAILPSPAGCRCEVSLSDALDELVDRRQDIDQWVGNGCSTRRAKNCGPPERLARLAESRDAPGRRNASRPDHRGAAPTLLGGEWLCVWEVP